MVGRPKFAESTTLPTSAGSHIMRSGITPVTALATPSMPSKGTRPHSRTRLSVSSGGAIQNACVSSR